MRKPLPLWVSGLLSGLIWLALCLGVLAWFLVIAGARLGTTG